MTSVALLAVGEKSAAQLLELKPKEFKALVDQGILPRPGNIGPYERWDAGEQRAVIRGEFVDGFEGVNW